MTDDERREIEWAENVQRLDFDDYEASKQRLADMRAEREAAVGAAKESEGDFCPESGQKPPPSRDR